MQSRSRLRVVLISVVTLLFSCPSAFSQQQTSSLAIPQITNQKYASDRILVKFHREIAAQTRAAVHMVVGGRTLSQYTAVRNLEAVTVAPGTDISEAIRAYRLRPEVEYAEPDYIVHLWATPGDPLFPQMWNLLNTGQNGGTSGADVGATLAWNLRSGR